MKKIARLGSTGSIGTQTLEVVRENGDLNVPTVSLLIVVWAKAICKGFRHLIWLMKYKASEKKEKKEAK